MSRKLVVWFALLALVMLVVPSCATPGPSTTSSQPSTTTAGESSSPAAESKTPASGPQYGGTLTLIMPSGRDITNWDPVGGYPMAMYDFMGMWYEHPMTGDWAKGPAGSNELAFAEGFVTLQDMVGTLAESWELKDARTWVMKVRKGVRFALDQNSAASRLVAGREMTPDDLIWTFKRVTTAKNSALAAGAPDLAKTATMEKTGDWEVTVKTVSDPFLGWTWITWGGGGFGIMAHEVIEKYGDALDWHNAVGTGPFMVADYVHGSSITLKKNPNYWKKDPAGPGKGNQVPYVDTAKFLIIPDTSTRLAALRTGAGDWNTDVPWDDALPLTEGNPSLGRQQFLSLAPWLVGMRQDKSDTPFSDVRVRRALTMATDFGAIKNDLYGGQAELTLWPVSKNYRGVYVPVEQMSQSIQELYTYNPNRAKQLLGDAGYADGFKTSMVVNNSEGESDVAQVLKEMWSKIDVDLNIILRDTSTYNSILLGRAHQDMIMAQSSISYSLYLAGSTWRGTSSFNTSYVDDPPGKDPVIENAYQEIQKHVLVDMPGADKIMKDTIVPYLLEGAYMIQIPKPYQFTLWQPWLKNYHGEKGSMADTFVVFTPYVWIDQAAKRQAVGR